MRTVIKNGHVINAWQRSEADVVVSDGRIEAVIERNGGSGVFVGSSDVVIDATDCLVIPGGVDAHVHMQLDTGKTVSSDTFFTGSVAAACGGTTTILDFAEQRAGGNVFWPVLRAAMPRQNRNVLWIGDFIRFSVESMLSHLLTRAH